jgi:hypothetical protein
MVVVVMMRGTSYKRDELQKDNVSKLKGSTAK